MPWVSLWQKNRQKQRYLTKLLKGSLSMASFTQAHLTTWNTLPPTPGHHASPLKYRCNARKTRGPLQIDEIAYLPWKRLRWLYRKLRKLPFLHTWVCRLRAEPVALCQSISEPRKWAQLNSRLWLQTGPSGDDKRLSTLCLVDPPFFSFPQFWQTLC